MKARFQLSRRRRFKSSSSELRHFVVRW